MNDTGCNKCDEGRVMVQDEDNHWHWEECSDCEEVSTGDGFGDLPPYVFCNSFTF